MSTAKAAFFAGLPVQFQNICTVYPLSVKEVVGNPEFGIYKKALTTSQEDLEDEYKKKDPNAEVPTPLEFLLNSCYHSKEVNEFTRRAFMKIIREPVTFVYQLKAILIGEVTGDMSIENFRLLNEDNFFEFQNLVRVSLGEKEEEKPDPNMHPKLKAMRAKARLRDRVKAKNSDSLNMDTILASICCMGIGITPLNIGELSYASISVLMKTYQYKEKYQIDIDSLLAGADSKKVQAEYWIRNLEEE